MKAITSTKSRAKEVALIYKEGYEAGLAAGKKETITENTSDGYHTFKELYLYRMLYNAAFFNELAGSPGLFGVNKSKRHSDGELCFGGGWFSVMAQLPTGQISNHYELKYWDLFKIPEKEVEDLWDGHTPQQAAERLEAYLALPVESLSTEKHPTGKKEGIMSFNDIQKTLAANGIQYEEDSDEQEAEVCKICGGTGSYKIPVSSPIGAPYGLDDTTSVPCECKIKREKDDRVARDWDD